MIISSCSFNDFAPYLNKALDVILSLPLYDRFEFDKQRYISEFREIYETYNVKHSPKRCHNCKRFFLLPTGHDTHYCNRVAPNDPKGRICSKVGPHKKENSDEFRSPLKKEYDRTYDRLFKRKSNGLDYSEWLKQMTLAMDIKERGESGEISYDEAIRLLKEI